MGQKGYLEEGDRSHDCYMSVIELSSWKLMNTRNSRRDLSPKCGRKTLLEGEKSKPYSLGGGME